MMQGIERNFRRHASAIIVAFGAALAFAPMWATAQDKPAAKPADAASPAAKAPDKPAETGPWLWQAEDVMVPKGQVTEAVPAEMRRLFKVIDDDAAQGKKALQVAVDKRLIRLTDPKKGVTPIPIAWSGGLTREQAPPGLYRVTVRMKMTGMLNVIGTGIWFKSAPMASPGLPPMSTIGGRELHGYEFTAEEAYQEFSYLTEVVEPDFVTNRPDRPQPRGALGQGMGGTKSTLEAMINPKPPTPEQEKAAAEQLAKQQAGAMTAFKSGRLSAVLQFMPTVMGGFGRVENSMQSVTVDWIRIEKVAEPAITARQVLPQKLWLRPGDKQEFHVWLHNRSGAAQKADVKLRVTHGLATPIAAGSKTVELKSGEYTVVTMPWDSPAVNLWGCEVTADVAQGGKTISSASDVFSVHANPWAIMNFGGANRSMNPYAAMPHYINYCESFGVTPGDAIKPFPDDPNLPYFTGMSGYATHIAFQKLLADHNRKIGVASFMYLSPLATSHFAEEAYQRKPELFFGRISWSDQADDQWRNSFKDLIDRFVNNKPPPQDPKAYDKYHIEVGVNAANKEIVDGLIDGIIKNMKAVGYDGVRWDGGPIEVRSMERNGVKVGPGSPEADQQLAADELRRMKKEIRAHFPSYTEGNNGVFGGLPSMLYNRKLDPPALETQKPFVAFMEDGSSLMDEGWMNAYGFLDVRNVIKDYFWGARQQTDYCRRAGGFLHTFSPARDGTPYFTQSTLYFNMLVALAGAQYPGKWSCPPASETGMAHFLTRFSELLWDNKLMWLKNAPELVRVDAPHELWWEETAVWRDLPDGKRRYVIPIVNPPTVERFYKNDRFSELAEPIREAIPVEVNLPESFKKGKAWMITAEPRTAAVALESRIEGGKVMFELPELVTFRVVVVEFEK